MTKIKNLKTVYGILIGLLLGLMGQFWFFPRQETDTASPAKDARVIAYWVAPMDPNYRRDGPGLSPMGMDLVPVYQDDLTSQEKNYEGVTIDPRMIANLGVETIKVAHKTLAPIIKTVGHIDYDEKALAHVHVRANGWVEKLYVRALGERVTKGNPLFEVYSSELNTAQAEFLQSRAAGRKNLENLSRERLRGLGLATSDIDQLARTGKALPRLTVRAPISGVVTKLNISDGAQVGPAMPALTVVDLANVWLLADVFEADIAHVKKGALLHIYDVDSQNKLANGHVDYIYPDLNMVSRTNPVRAVIDNESGYFKPGQFVRVEIERGPLEGLFVPSNSIIRLNEESRVILAEGEGRFRPAKVTIGETIGADVQIIAGLMEGEHVVAAGQFMLDGESNFQNAFLRLEAPKNPESTAGKATNEIHYTNATIHALDQKGRLIHLSHDGISALDIGPMTLDIEAGSDLDMTVVHKGRAYIGLRAAGASWRVVSVRQPADEET